MKKKIILSLTAAAALTTAAVFAGAFSSGEDFNQENRFEPSYERLANHMGYETEEKFDKMHKATIFMEKYCNNEESFSYIENLILNGYDAQTVIGTAKYFVATHSQEITFVGHSKGGGEAIAAATATNNNAITFNAANFNFLEYGLIERNKSGITNYYINGEILSSIIGESRYGTNIPIATEYWNEYSLAGVKVRVPAPIKNHTMDAFMDAWGLEW